MYHSMREIALISQMARALENCDFRYIKSKPADDWGLAYDAWKSGSFTDDEIKAYGEEAFTAERHRRRLRVGRGFNRRTA